MDKMMESAATLIHNLTTPASAPTTPISFPAINLPLISALIAVLLAQSAKLFFFWRLAVSGGMPSSHSAIVSALVVAIGLQDGFAEPAFATAFILAFVVTVTAVRLHAGRPTEVQNQMVSEVPPSGAFGSLRGLLAYAPPQVDFWESLLQQLFMSSQYDHNA